MPRPLIIHHADCADGFGAAYVALRHYAPFRDRRPEILPAQYGDPAPSVRGRDVLVLDFSYPRADLVRMAAEASSILVLDHHATAEAELGDLPFARFDSSCSGVRLAWDLCRPGKPAPALVRYIEDRDLWRWSLPGSREISAAIRSWPLDLDVWDRELGALLEPMASEASDRRQAELYRMGEAILRVQAQQVEAIARNRVAVELAGVRGVGVWSPILASEVAERIYTEDRAAAYVAVLSYAGKDGQVLIQLRSRKPDGADVGALARAIGGGGHRHAAGALVIFDSGSENEGNDEYLWKVDSAA